MLGKSVKSARLFSPLRLAPPACKNGSRGRPGCFWCSEDTTDNRGKQKEIIRTGQLQPQRSSGIHLVESSPCTLQAPVGDGHTPLKGARQREETAGAADACIRRDGVFAAVQRLGGGRGFPVIGVPLVRQIVEPRKAFRLCMRSSVKILFSPQRQNIKELTSLSRTERLVRIIRSTFHIIDDMLSTILSTIPHVREPAHGLDCNQHCICLVDSSG